MSVHSTAIATISLMVALLTVDDPPRAPIPRAPLPVESTPSKPAEKQPAEPSDLHSHLCSRCNHEWWHDPKKGPVSHNCPKCGREQWVINRRSPPAPRDIASPAASPRQESRGAASEKVVYVVGSTTCYACKVFRQKHGDGTAAMRYVYCNMDQARPASIDVATWNEIVKHNNTLKFTWPFFVMNVDGEWIAVQTRVE